MRNILNIDIRKTPYVYGYSNEGVSNINEIEFLFITPKLTNPYVEITKQDGTTETLALGNDLPFEIYKNQGTIKLKVKATDYESEYITLSVPSALETTDNVIVKMESDVYIIRKVKVGSSSSGGTTDHNELNNLHYDNSGHIGFASSEELELLKEEIENIAQTDYSIVNSDETLEIEKDGNVTTINTKVVVVKDSNYEFPNRGVENALYIDKANKMIYIWVNGGYQPLYDTETINEQIEIINGGNANG